MKRCTKCGETKMLPEFGNKASAADGLNTQCRTCVATYNAQARATTLAARRAYDRAYAARHVLRARARASEWNLAHPERVRARIRKWQKANPDKLRAEKRKRRARIMGAGGGGISAAQWREVLLESLGICAYCNGRRKLTLDHVVPLVAGGAHDVENAAAVCRRCNASKGDTPLVVWLAKRRAA